MDRQATRAKGFGPWISSLVCCLCGSPGLVAPKREGEQSGFSLE
jgi:hypothetical protein